MGVRAAAALQTHAPDLRLPTRVTVRAQKHFLAPPRHRSHRRGPHHCPRGGRCEDAACRTGLPPVVAGCVCDSSWGLLRTGGFAILRCIFLLLWRRMSCSSARVSERRCGLTPPPVIQTLFASPFLTGKPLNERGGDGRRRLRGGAVNGEGGVGLVTCLFMCDSRSPYLFFVFRSSVSCAFKRLRCYGSELSPCLSLSFSHSPPYYGSPS